MNAIDALKERALPPLLVDKAKNPITTPEGFEARREEIKNILQENEYGRIPPRPDHMSVEIVREEPYIRRTAIIQYLKFTFEMGDEEFSFPAISVIPNTQNVCPAFVHISFFANGQNKYQPTEEIVDRNYAIFSFFYKDVAGDDNDFESKCAKYLCKSRRRSNSTSKIAMWAWAAMRMMDYIETLPYIDHRHVAVIGHSRLGKTALVAGGFDERFKYVISNDSGMSGAAITRGKVGEDQEAITRVFPFWFCPKYIENAPKSAKAKFDQHFLNALTVPRHLMVGSAKEDTWADPTSEFLGVLAVNEAYALYGMKGLVHTGEIPQANTYLSDGDSHYHVRRDGHYLSRHDWIAYMNFIDKHR